MIAKWKHFADYKSTEQDKAFTSIKDSVSIQIFKIQSNVTGVQKLVDRLGTQGDGSTLRESLHNLTESTREMVKNSTEDVKKLAAFPTGGPHVSRYISFRLILAAKGSGPPPPLSLSRSPRMWT